MVRNEIPGVRQRAIPPRPFDKFDAQHSLQLGDVFGDRRLTYA
jgi:hypothetical protein